ncbi:insulinase family protein, partial [Candidatus Parcubacteria bacterium]
GVIVEEIKMYEENPIMHIGDLLEEAMFSGNRLGMEIAGSIESVKRMKRADVIEYRDSYYIPSEMTVVVAGNIPKDIKEILEKTFGRVPERSKPPGFEPYKNDEQRIRIRRQYKDLKQIQIALGFAMPGRGDKDLPVINLLSGLLGGAMSSRLFIEVRERRGLCYTIRSFTEAYADIGVFGIKAGLDAKRLKAAMKVIFSELAKIKKNGVTNKELQYIKDHVAGSLALGLENTSSYAEFVGRQELLLGEVKTPDEKLAEIQAVKRADIKRVAEQILDFNNFAVAAIGPYQTDEELMAYLPASIK